MKNEIIRHFTYCDVKGIDSIYSQMFSNTEEITITDKRSRELSGKAELPNILQGFWGANITGEYSRDRSTEHSSKVTISIEDKVCSIMSSLKNEENKKLNKWPDTPTLVSGYATIIEYRAFTERLNYLFKTYKLAYSDFESFLEDNHNKQDFENMWAEFMDFARKNNAFRDHGAYMKLIMHMGSNPTVMKSIAVDLKYPVFLHYSTEKLLISNSETENVGMITRLPKTGILGIQSKADTNIYTIKPLAMWHDISYEGYSDFIDRASDFLNIGKV